MKVSETIVSTTENGDEIEGAEPATSYWSKDADELDAIAAVVAMIRGARDIRYVRTLSITIEF